MTKSQPPYGPCTCHALPSLTIISLCCSCLFALCPNFLFPLLCVHQSLKSMWISEQINNMYVCKFRLKHSTWLGCLWSHPDFITMLSSYKITHINNMRIIKVRLWFQQNLLKKWSLRWKSIFSAVCRLLQSQGEGNGKIGVRDREREWWRPDSTLSTRWAIKGPASRYTILYVLFPQPPSGIQNSLAFIYYKLQNVTSSF